MSTVRLKRLTADFDKIKEYTRLHPRVRLLQAQGEPPERYQLEYRISSVRMVDDQLRGVKDHMVEIVLPRNYPRTPPQCRMLSPVFHPNIAPHAICVGDHWSPGEPLVSIAIRIGELLAYQVYNVKSPLNGDAARWVEENEEKLPLDRVSLLVEENGQAASSPPTPSINQSATPVKEAPPTNQNASPAKVAPPTNQRVAPPSDSSAGVAANSTAQQVISCPSCEKKFKFRPEMLGQKLRCNACGAVFTLPASL